MHGIICNSYEFALENARQYSLRDEPFENNAGMVGVLDFVFSERVFSAPVHCDLVAIQLKLVINDTPF